MYIQHAKEYYIISASLLYYKYKYYANYSITTTTTPTTASTVLTCAAMKSWSSITMASTCVSACARCMRVWMPPSAASPKTSPGPTSCSKNAFGPCAAVVHTVIQYKHIHM